MNHSLLTEHDSLLLRTRLTTQADFEHEQRIKTLLRPETREQRRERIAVALMSKIMEDPAAHLPSGVAHLPNVIARRAGAMAEALVSELEAREAAEREAARLEVEAAAAAQRASEGP